MKGRGCHLLNEELNNLCCSCSTIRLIESKRRRLIGHLGVTGQIMKHDQNTISDMSLLAKPGRNTISDMTLLARPGHNLENHREKECEHVNYIQLV
jgi:hypothetical protein